MNIDDWKSQIKRGTLEFGILLMISQEPCYGYEIISRLEKVADFICKGKHCVSPFAKAAERGISVFLLAGDNRGAAAQKILFAYRKGQRISAVYENRMEESFICNFRLGGKRKWIKF